MGIKLALFQPDIPQNTGSLLRLAACFNIPLEIIEPCGFVWSDRRLQRAGMDYTELAMVTRHISWDKFQNSVSGRMVLLTTKGTSNYTNTVFTPEDILILGRETAGVPNDVHLAADLCVRIPVMPGTRSLNVALAGAMVLGEALRQLREFPR